MSALVDTKAPAIVWDADPPDGFVGYGADDRIYAVSYAGNRWRWVLPQTNGEPGQQRGAFLTAKDAKADAERHEEETIMGKGKAKKDKGAGANGANGSAPKGEAELRGHERPGGVVRASFVENLPCKMDAAEVEALEHKLTTVTREKVRKEAEKVALSEEIKGLKKREDSLVAQLEDEAELRDIDCEEILYVETNAVDTVRKDTGEVIRTRTATDEDRQEDIDGALAQKLLGGALGKKDGDTDPPAAGPVGDGGDDGDDLFGGDQPGAEG